MPLTVDQVRSNALKGRANDEYKKGLVVAGGGHMSLLKNYSYVLEEDAGTGFDPRFKPVLSPGEILFMGAFEGRYLSDCTDEFPKEWFLMALGANKLSPGGGDPTCNYFGIRSRQPLSVWVDNGWAPSIKKTEKSNKGKAKTRDILADPVRNPDERGWFQWYCRYWIGRRIPDLDSVQIGRWRSFARHAGAVKKGCAPGDLNCRRRERQALLQWAYDPFI
jgi:hypothetical protein